MSRPQSYTSKPARLIALSFLVAIAVGTVLLMLPISSHGSRLSALDGVFMATSGICVTGLSVVDVGADLTRFGQTVLLILIQLGGLGIMTFSLFFLLVFNIPTISHLRLTSSGVSRRSDGQTLLYSLKRLLAWTFLVEAVGSVLFFLRLRSSHEFGEAVFHSIFHSISAFCNAGFSLYADSLTQFQSEFFFPLTAMTLIVLGGLGYLVVFDVTERVKSHFQRKPSHLSLHTKVCLTMTAVLLVAGFVVVFGLEHDNLLQGQSRIDQVMNSLFLSITSRTAGFNTMPTSGLSSATLFFLLLLMFIGGCPGSTAGGIKVTTFTVVLAVVRSRIKAMSSVSLMKRKVPVVIIGKSLAVFGAGFVFLLSAVFLLQITEASGVAHGAVDGSFLGLLFEATSAFGTVGLSTGATATLTPFGKIIVIVLMFAGRIGPLTLGLFILARYRRQLNFEYPEEELLIG